MHQIQDTQRLFRLWGTVTNVSAGMVHIAGVSSFAGIGNEIQIEKNGHAIYGEILKVSGDHAVALLYSAADLVRIGDRAFVTQTATVEVGDHWLGQVVNYRGEISDPGRAKPRGHSRHMPLRAQTPPAHLRGALGPRLSTGLMVTDTLLPICRGQRMGLFAGSGVGKSTLVGKLARGLEADRVVIALVGERSLEVSAFVKKTLTAEMLEKAVIVAATSSEPPGAKKRAAYCAMAAAEHFRDQGHNVLLLFDSITRFAEAHRETALLAGEAPALNAFPPSTVRVIAELAERSGPGIEGTGDITGIYSVLVAGSDMEEPVADMIRGILDGHIILSREIAERGRYPAIDVLKSVSRSLPSAASDVENSLLKDYRRMIALYEDVSPMLRANLYSFGKDLDSDRAVQLFPLLDAFAGRENHDSIENAFRDLSEQLSSATVDLPA